MQRFAAFSLAYLLTIGQHAWAQDLELRVFVEQRYRNLSGTLFSAFVEDINHSVTGGLSAELLSDVQTRGPLRGSEEWPRVSVESVIIPGFVLRYCSQYILTQDGTADATFYAQRPGLGGDAATVSFGVVNDPMYSSVGGNYIVVGQGGSIKQGTPDGSASFNLSATFSIEAPPPGSPNGSVALRSMAPWANGYYLTAGAYKTSGGCSDWIGDNYAILATNASSPGAAWYLAAPRQPDQAAWEIDNGSSATATAAFDAPTQPLNANISTALRVTVAPAASSSLASAATSSPSSSSAAAGVCNVGYYGIGVNSGDVFNASLWLYPAPGSSFSTVLVTLESLDGSAVWATQTVQISQQAAWAHYTVQLTATAAGQNSLARFCVRPLGTGTVWLAQPSLMPAVTFAGRRNGMRADIAGLVAAMQPAALRFPGGCFAEGLNHSTAYNFTTTVGPIETRAGHYNLWSYWSHDRVGLYEYLQWAEDMGAEPVWVANVGLFYGTSVQDPVQMWIDHALQSLEFAMGDANDTYWGRVRATMGHPDPFPIHYVAIGNENYGSVYVQHYTAAYTALKAAYPSITYIANSNISSPSVPVDMFDYHVYPPHDYFYAHQWDWDAVTARGPNDPKVFNSEYASKQGAGRGNLQGALGEAAWMTGLERNSDLVQLAAYAPLLANANDTTWLPDAIMFNAQGQAYGTPSYWNQRLFSTNAAKGSVLLGYNLTASAEDARSVGAGIVAGPGSFQAGIPVANNATNVSVSVSLQTVDTQPTVVIKLVNYANATRKMAVSLQGLPQGWSQPASGSLSSIASPTSDPLDENTFDQPERVAIVTQQVATGPGDVVSIPPFSIHVLRLPVLVQALR